MSIEHLDTSRILHELFCIAAIARRLSSTYEIKKPIKLGKIESSFLLDTVIHISSYIKFLKK